jgi:hypothetical protein
LSLFLSSFLYVFSSFFRCLKKYEGKNHFEDLGIDGSYIHSIALDRALASLTGFMVVGYTYTMWGYQPHDQPGSSHLIRPPRTSVSKASRHHLVAEQVKLGWETWPLNFADEHLSCS